jgi:hypothetical protein
MWLVVEIGFVFKLAFTTNNVETCFAQYQIGRSNQLHQVRSMSLKRARIPERRKKRSLSSTCAALSRRMSRKAV